MQLPGGTPTRPIRAIFVFNDPADWCVCDVVQCATYRRTTHAIPYTPCMHSRPPTLSNPLPPPPTTTTSHSHTNPHSKTLRYRDLQLTIDVLLGGGVLGHHIQPPHAAPVIPLFFSNPDLLWANEHPAPRFGQGAFAAALHALYEKVCDGCMEGVWRVCDGCMEGVWRVYVGVWRV